MEWLVSELDYAPPQPSLHSELLDALRLEFRIKYYNKIKFEIKVFKKTSCLVIKSD